MILEWSDIWGSMELSERGDACLVFVDRLKSGPPTLIENYTQPFLRQFAKHLRFRPQTVMRMSAQVLSRELQKHIVRVFRKEDWSLFFQTYYVECKRELICRFMDLSGIPHDGHGIVSTSDVTPPEDIHSIAMSLSAEFGTREVVRYFNVLRLNQPEAWEFLGEVNFNRVYPAPVPPSDARPDEPVGDDSEEATSDLSEEFTQLDRVLIDQVIMTVAEEERALKPSQLVDLVETVHALDASRKRTYFHLGFVDALLPERDPDFDRPEMNDERRGWYLAGLLSGLVRRRDKDGLDYWINARREDFLRTVSERRRTGALIARSVLPALLEYGHIAEAVAVLRGQLKECGPGTALTALSAASEYLRRGDAANAHSLLVVVRDGLERMDLERGQRIKLHAYTCRKLGQAMQLQGELGEAKRLFSEILDGAGDHSEDLLADMGLVESGFGSLSEVRIPVDKDRRAVIRDALRNGESYFREAVEKEGVQAINANYALAVLSYLDCMNPEGGESTDTDRQRAMRFVSNALSGMIQSGSANAYEELGLAGQCRFMQAVLQMAALEPGQAPAAMNAWRAINEQTGKLPAWDVQVLLERADAIDPTLAIEIAESVWKHRKQDAMEIIRNPAWVRESEYLRKELLDIARSDSQSGEKRWTLWTLIVPSLLQAGEISLAQEGLDALEGLALENGFAERLMEWLGKSAHYDPAWTHTDVLRARFRLLRRLGRDPDSFAAMRELFFALRDSEAEEAAQLLALFEELSAPRDFFEDLRLPVLPDDSVQPVDGQTEDALRQGEGVKVLFVGGNETQAQYDETVARELKREWPGAEVHFEHTGWSSNWGREKDRILRMAADSDAVVLMTMMRTMLGRTLREGLNKPPRPWVPCTGRGKRALFESIRKAAIVGLNERNRREQRR